MASPKYGALRGAARAGWRHDGAVLLSGVLLGALLCGGRAPPAAPSTAPPRAPAPPEADPPTPRLARMIARTTLNPRLRHARRLFVIPGGGPGAPEDHGLPLWTIQRADAALAAYRALSSDAEVWGRLWFRGWGGFCGWVL